MGLGVPLLTIMIIPESSPLKSTMLVGRLGVQDPPASASTAPAGERAPPSEGSLFSLYVHYIMQVYYLICIYIYIYIHMYI